MERIPNYQQNLNMKQQNNNQKYSQTGQKEVRHSQDGAQILYFNNQNNETIKKQNREMNTQAQLNQINHKNAYQQIKPQQERGVKMQENNNKPKIQPNKQEKDNKKFSKSQIPEKINVQTEDDFWKCKTCKNLNRQYYEEKCKFCSEYKYRTYDRMRKDIGKKDYDYLFFVDYECNNDEKYGFEIIEFPIHVVDVKTYQLIESFSSFVKPSSNITQFITELTQITNNQVKNAPTLEKVLEYVQTFLDKYLKVGLDRCAVVYDCDNDSNFLFNETQKKKLTVPPIFEKYICLKSIFPAEINQPPRVPASLSKMLRTLKMEFQGQKHCGSDDAKNQAAVGIELLKRGYNFSKRQEIKLGNSSSYVNKFLKTQQKQEYQDEYNILKNKNSSHHNNHQQFQIKK